MRPLSIAVYTSFLLVSSVALSGQTTQPSPLSSPAKPSPGSAKDFTLPADQLYCDYSIPYSYTSTSALNGLGLQVFPKGEQNGWATVLTNAWKQLGPIPSWAPNGQQLTPSVTFTADAQPLKNGGTDAAPSPAHTLADNGESLLGDPAHTFSANTFDAQRLLIRTLFGPNPLQLACDPRYLTDDIPPPSKPTQETKLFTRGSGFALSLNDRQSPQYYLIDIVRWRDAPAPKDAPSGTRQAFFQAASDDWYLLNYSDSQLRQQDLAKALRKITPAFATDTLRILGSSRVMFLGIHLAPQPTQADSAAPNPTPQITRTEQAWFDDVSIAYKISASSYQPTQLADLSTALQILAADAGLPTTTAPPTRAVAGAAPTPVRSTGPQPFSTFQGRYAAGLLTNLTKLPVNFTSTWTATFTSATPSPGDSTIYKPLAKPATAKSQTDSTAPPASASICTIALSSPAPAAKSTGPTPQTPCTDPGSKVRDEGRSFWDVSVAIPLNGYSDLTFQATPAPAGASTPGPTVITAKAVSRANAYGLFDLYLIPEDLVDPPYIGIPHLIVGLPFAGKVFDKPLFAVGETLNLPKALSHLPGIAKVPVLSTFSSSNIPLAIRPVFGWVYNKEFPTPNGGANTSRRALKPQFAIEISFSAVSSAVKTLSKTSTSASTVPPSN